MGAELFDARPELLDRSGDVLGWSLREVCLDGPIELLTRTDRAQPALFALSYVLFQELMSHLDDGPAAAAGHSLGEYTAFAASGVFEFDEALRLVAERGAAMAEAAGLEASSMAALLGADDDLADSIAADRRADGGRLWVANYNAPGQVVLAGAAVDIEWVVESARDLGVRRAVPLNVAGAFHSPLMEPAKNRLSDALDQTDPQPAQFPVWANTTAAPAGAAVRTLLLDQLVSPVRFAGSLAGMAQDGHETFVHVGPGDVTAGMAKRAVRGARVLVVNDLESARSVAGELAG